MAARKTLRVPWIEYGIVRIYRHTLGFYLYDNVPFLQYWHDGPMPLPPRYHHLLLAGTGAFVFLVALAVDAVWTALGLRNGGIAQSVIAFLYTLACAIFVYNLVCALVVPSHPSRLWRWSSSSLSELVLLLTSASLAWL
jgi:hypothetical protein